MWHLLGAPNLTLLVNTLIAYFEGPPSHPDRLGIVGLGGTGLVCISRWQCWGGRWGGSSFLCSILITFGYFAFLDFSQIEYGLRLLQDFFSAGHMARPSMFCIDWLIEYVLFGLYIWWSVYIYTDDWLFDWYCYYYNWRQVAMPDLAGLEDEKTLSYLWLICGPYGTTHCWLLKNISYNFDWLIQFIDSALFPPIMVEMGHMAHPCLC